MTFQPRLDKVTNLNDMAVKLGRNGPAHDDRDSGVQRLKFEAEWKQSFSMVGTVRARDTTWYQPV
ncbi:hypothetical protein VMCG_05895 [Cytospora schulzeri]|uniref:Uncharacterized protein n=1 Tax=Cytospora schulzeri TaxID=448051 RepID=A0A423WD13_9PEZI|nr:hypothetical protein VMCG_05895 [Valsa malicola]